MVILGKAGKTYCSKCFKFKTNHDQTVCPYPDYHIIPEYLLNNKKYKNNYTANKIREANK